MAQNQVIYARQAILPNRSGSRSGSGRSGSLMEPLWLPLLHPGVPYSVRLLVRDHIAAQPDDTDGEVHDGIAAWAWLRVIFHDDPLLPSAWTVRIGDAYLASRRRGGDLTRHFHEACFFGSPQSAHAFLSPGAEVAPAFGEPWDLVEDFWAMEPQVVPWGTGQAWSIRTADIGYDLREEGHPVRLRSEQASGLWVWDGGQIELRRPSAAALVLLDRALRRAGYLTWIPTPGWGDILAPLKK